jgi:hypothetical protein
MSLLLIGWKIPGTQVPWVITAGTYIKKRKTQFWDVCNKKNALLSNSKIPTIIKIIEVENPELVMQQLNAK